MTFLSQYQEYQTNAHHERAGAQYRYRFPNGWGASVVCNRYSYGGERGLWELAVLGQDGDLNYVHPVSEGDVRGYQTDADIAELLKQIKETP